MCVCLQPDDVEGKIREIIPAGFTCNTDDFVSLLEKEANFKPFGTLLHTYTVHNEEAGQLTYQIHKVQIPSTCIVCLLTTVLTWAPVTSFIFTQSLRSSTQTES